MTRTTFPGPSSVEDIYTEEETVMCGGGPLGHPTIYLTLEKTGEIICPYCSRRYLHKGSL